MNWRAKDSYAEKRHRLGGSRRICRECGNILSQYNEENLCAVCIQKPELRRTNKLRDLVNGTNR
jgi:uncharacterized paraquat-inducible protein A